jgi:hypothetical protein
VTVRMVRYSTSYFGYREVTVKGHEEYQGTKQTVLTRCSVIEEITG